MKRSVPICSVFNRTLIGGPIWEGPCCFSMYFATAGGDQQSGCEQIKDGSEGKICEMSERAPYLHILPAEVLEFHISDILYIGAFCKAPGRVGSRSSISELRRSLIPRTCIPPEVVLTSS